MRVNGVGNLTQSCKDDLLCVRVSGEGVGAEEPAAVTIASAQQAVFTDNVQYQFRTENSSGQVSLIFHSFGGKGEFYGGQEGVRSDHEPFGVLGEIFSFL